ncbi:protein rpi-1-like isoform X1 [Dermacentor albipictus]|uniref:protein rpi-1-like isoform X1 n=1 Tax=Dermacentor albipictus TaxID=60249 RepID=UPI0031FDE327
MTMMTSFGLLPMFLLFLQAHTAMGAVILVPGVVTFGGNVAQKPPPVVLTDGSGKNKVVGNANPLTGVVALDADKLKDGLGEATAQDPPSSQPPAPPTPGDDEDNTPEGEADNPSTGQEDDPVEEDENEPAEDNEAEQVEDDAEEPTEDEQPPEQPEESDEAEEEGAEEEGAEEEGAEEPAARSDQAA